MATSTASLPNTSQDEVPQLAVKTLGKALQLLQAVAAFPHPPTVGELAASVGLARPTVHRLVQSLVAADFLQQNPADARLTIGFSVLPLASSLLDHNRLRLGAMPHLQALATRMNARVNLGILHRHQVLILAGVEKPNLPTIYSRFGRSVPLHSTGLGKAILASLTDARARELLQAQEMVARTPQTITRLPAMLKELAAVRARGYATERAESTPTSTCVAVALLDGHGQPIGAISASGQPLDKLEAGVQALLETAEIVSHLP